MKKTIYIFFWIVLYYDIVNWKGKFYSCQFDLFDSCSTCEFRQIQETEKLTCTDCYNGYYLNSEGKCISFIHQIQRIPHCLIHIFTIDEMIFDFDIRDNTVTYSYYNYNYYYYYYYIHQVINEDLINN